ncbi:MATE family efflux transporter [Orrella marina]|uniref:MATE family efflux transporter n=1 Tax=Orrella marina TaxID=2163011 RepID=A0A2R4XIH9_9BURK|nr:MATE family efflux transporter [Orrella marina]AWB33563.1 MATE family efflux transporter [Orrella marina]
MTSSRPMPTTPGVSAHPLRSILKQAWPILISQWASIAFGVLDTAMTGHASPTDLAALALGISIYITVFIGLMGVMHALIPIQAQSFGGKRFDEIGQFWSQGVWVSLLLSIMGAMVLSFPDIWLSVSGDISPAVRERLAEYLFALTLGLPAALLFRTVYSLANAVSRPKMIMVINLVGVGLKAFLNWVFIFGNFGMPAMGAAGAGLASSIVFWVNLSLALWWVYRTPYFKQFSLTIRMPVWSQMWEILRLGLPMGASYMIEVGAFTFMALLVAREGTSVTGGHQITSNLAALSYMMPLAIGIATASLTAQAIGAQQHELAHKTGMTGLKVVFVGALLTACGLYFGRSWIVAAYTSDPVVASIAMSLLVILPWFHVIDALHCANAYLLRAHKVAMAPLVIQGFALTFVGLLGGWYLGFGPGVQYMAPLRQTLLADAPPGAGTMWVMSSVGLGLSGLMLHIWYRRLIARKNRVRLPLNPTLVDRDE